MDNYRAEAKCRWQESQRASGGVGGAEAAPAASGAETHPATSASGLRSSSQKTSAPARGVPQDGDILGGLQAWWTSLAAEQQTQALAVCGVVCAVLIMGSRSVPALAALALLCYLSARVPSTASFEPFFREWFTQEYFPQVSQKLQRELQARSEKEHNLLDSLASKFKGWVVGKTEKLSAIAMYEFVVKYSLPPTWRHWYFLRTATVNLGSRSHPAYLTFWGVHGFWMLAPYITVDLENTSILEELQRSAASVQ